jgi:hypothetical protein
VFRSQQAKQEAVPPSPNICFLTDIQNKRGGHHESGTGGVSVFVEKEITGRAGCVLRRAFLKADYAVVDKVFPSSPCPWGSRGQLGRSRPSLVLSKQGPGFMLPSRFGDVS